MICRSSPMIFEVAPLEDDNRFPPFIKELQDSIPSENIQHDPESGVYYISIMSEDILTRIYNKYFTNPDQLSFL